MYVTYQKALRSYDVMKHGGPENWQYIVKIDENSFYSKLEFHRFFFFFLLIQKENNNMFCKFQLHGMQIFLKLAT